MSGKVTPPAAICAGVAGDRHLGKPKLCCRRVRPRRPIAEGAPAAPRAFGAALPRVFFAVLQ